MPVSMCRQAKLLSNTANTAQVGAQPLYCALMQQSSVTVMRTDEGAPEHVAQARESKEDEATHSYEARLHGQGQQER